MRSQHPASAPLDLDPPVVASHNRALLSDSVINQRTCPAGALLVRNGSCTQPPTLSKAQVVLMSSSYSYETRPSVPMEASPKTGRMEMCPQGTLLSPNTCQSLSAGCACVACRNGSYQNTPNLEVSCQPCSHCLSYFGQMVVRTCTATQDTECGCKRGYYKAPRPFSDSNDLNCKICTNCSTMHRETQRDCSEAADAECGGCLPTFCDIGSHCQPCPRTTPQQEQLTNPTFPSDIVTPSVETCGTACQASTWWLSGSTPCPEIGLLADGAPLPTPVLQQGRKLYAIIDAVPVRRWKEFVRGLGLRDGEIELVELEHSQFREQQYEMLKRWRQRRGASLDAVFATLEEMQLGGCAQELREQLGPKRLLHPFL
uniref:Tumor necrosis factor receptor superfamily member 25 isoform X3 n=1 Tax=Pogona vitticeps TaxID=103695 RepID=A0ABM5EL01_9SAUR